MLLEIVISKNSYYYYFVKLFIVENRTANFSRKQQTSKGLRMILLDLKNG